ncbi:MAG TPA: DNA double-strand break repair nuclease NurA [Candidatus Babeliales bacterium]|nr:DNA double-strand break repair nuclease NurA [Candidatus Babeliales bacterium]
MLDRVKLLVELTRVTDQLFVDTTSSYNLAQEIWHAISKDSTFLYKVRQVNNAPWPVPLWQGNVGDIIPVERATYPHVVLSVDGSQIYPDRHNILSCCLINTGFVVLPYNCKGMRVQLLSQPTVFAGVDENGQPFTTDSVNCKRQELELRAGLHLGKKIKSEYSDTAPTILFFDGSLIFWHLSSKEIHVRDQFLSTYLALLDELYHEKILLCWYISTPKSKELISLIRLYLCNFDVENKEAYALVDSVIDSGIMQNVLMPYTRSIVFSNHSSISAYYPHHLRPFFFYIHTGSEIGRVELPAWVAQDTMMVDRVAQIVIDQCIKGGGYPVALAEAHEQAVVKGQDREFFYHYLQKMGMERNYAQAISRKSLRKRSIGI